MNIEVSFKEVASLIQRAFPGAKSRRTVKIAPMSIYHVADYWDGGSRDECKFIELSTMTVLGTSNIPTEMRQKIANPFNLPICDVILKPGFIVIEHVWFCGKDMGYRIYCSPDRFEGLNASNILTCLCATVEANANNLPAPDELYDNGLSTVPYRNALTR